MNSSNTITKLAEALKKAQEEMKNPGFDAVNPHFSSKYASLAAVREAVLPVLNKHGLVLTQFPKYAPEREHAGCVSRLMHVSGEWLEEECLLPVGKATAHAAGSCITYARRYSMQGIAGVVAEEDDDGNSASNSKPTGASAANHEAFAGLPKDRQKAIRDTAILIGDHLAEDRAFDAYALCESFTENDEKLALWSQLSSSQRSAIKKQSALEKGKH